MREWKPTGRSSSGESKLGKSFIDRSCINSIKRCEEAENSKRNRRAKAKPTTKK